MEFISFSQNFEDFRLWRALNDVKEGSYLDIGAYDPVYDSVSAHFYESGWRGVNVEPVKEEFEKYEFLRSEDLSLNLAIASQPGELTFHQVINTGLSTADHNTASAITNFPVKALEVRAITLDALLGIHPCDEIHWMKIDVEGYEENVLAGWNSSHKRPWIIVIEATIPSTKIRRTFIDNPTLLGFDYVFSYFDGLNEFYVHKSQLSRSVLLAEPISIFNQVVQANHFISHVILEQKSPINLDFLTNSLKAIANDYLKTLSPEFDFLRTRFSSQDLFTLPLFLTTEDGGQVTLKSQHSTLLDNYLLQETIKKEMHKSSIISQEYFELQDAFMSSQLHLSNLEFNLMNIERSRTFRYTKSLRAVLYMVLEQKNTKFAINDVRFSKPAKWVVKNLINRMQSNLRLRSYLIKFLPNSLARKLRLYVMKLQYTGYRTTLEEGRNSRDQIEPSELHSSLFSIWKNR